VRHTISWLLLSVACGDTTTGSTTQPRGSQTSTNPANILDGDADGWVYADDCDDEDPDVNPEADELCDGIDNDCDGRMDQDALDALPWFVDHDLDGSGSGDPLWACDAPPGLVATDDDCNDEEPLASPLLAETCHDGIDNDCDGTDNDCGLPSEWLWSDGLAITGTLGERLGQSGDAIDVDGDGVPELALGAPKANGLTGSVYVFGGISPTGGPWDPSMALATLTGEASGDDAGHVVVSVGDMSGDGVADVAVSAPLNDNGGTDAGAVYLVHGPLADGPLAASAGIIQGQSGDWLGANMATAGDSDGDGRADLWIVANHNSGVSLAGAAYLFSGATSGATDTSTALATVLATQPLDSLPFSVASNRDLTGDGVPDAVFGAGEHGVGGAAYLFAGPVTGTLDFDAADETWEHLEAGAGFGMELALCDTSGDGLADLIVGAPASPVSGNGYDAEAVYLFYGPTTGTDPLNADAILYGGQDNDAGWRISGAGDVDDDGVQDLWVEERDIGAHLLYGPVEGLRALTTSDLFVVAYGADTLIGGADFDGDGDPDLALGAPNQAFGAGEARIFLHYGW
jgi:hypothetical protein